MAIQLQIGNKTVSYPEPGDNPGWGEDGTKFAQLVADALTTVQGPNDITTTTTALSNDVSSDTAIAGLSFNLVEVRRATVEYVMVRIFDSGASTIVESGTITGDYDGTNFDISVEANDDSGITFNSNSSGQILYQSDDKTNNVSITMTYQAKTIDNP